MTLSRADQQVLDEVADALRASDLRLARRLTGLRNRTHRRRRAVCGVLVGLALMVTGLPVTLTSPAGGASITVAGAMVVAAYGLSISLWGLRPGVHSGRPLRPWSTRRRHADDPPRGTQTDEPPRTTS